MFKFASLAPQLTVVFKIAAPNLGAATGHFRKATQILKTPVSSVPKALRPSSPSPLGASLRDALKKNASLGTQAFKPANVGRLRGMMTSNALKTPGIRSASNEAMKPTRGIMSAMSFGKPH